MLKYLSASYPNLSGPNNKIIEIYQARKGYDNDDSAKRSQKDAEQHVTNRRTTADQRKHMGPSDIC